MTEENQFHLQGHLDTLYRNSTPKFKFNATTPDDFYEWQTQFREALSGVLGIAGRIVPEIPQVTLLMTHDRGTFIEEKYVLDVGEVLAPMYLLIPKSPPPYKPVLALHGHAPSIHLMLGNDPNTSAGDNNFAQLLAKDGYLVCAIEQRGFGERVTNQIGDNPSNNACRHLAFEYLMNGRTLLGERVYDGMVAINYLKTRTNILTDELACVGFSGGGATAFFLSALDDYICTAVISSYFCAFKQSILGVRHCECNYVPGILTLGEMGDIAGLIAPRSLRFITGENDPIFPIAGVYEQYRTVERVYALLNAKDRCSLTIHDGIHQHHHGLCREWLT